MKRIITYILILFVAVTKAQNDDCIDAIPLCTTPNFTFFATSGPGNVIDFTTSSTISNPQTNPNPPNMGCLLSGELKPQWLLVTVGNAGNLEFVFGAANSANPQAGFYDWAMWPYTASSCSQIFNNTLAPIRCNWNATSTGGTGMASAANIPTGGNAGNYEAPLAVNACQQFVICISNFSGVNTLVSFQSLGTASLSCNPNCNPSYAICPGASITVSPVNFANLTNPTFSLFPGPVTNTTGNFVVSPSTTTQYTTYITGTNSSNAVQTISATLNVTVYPKPYTSPIINNGTCASPSNSANLNVTFSPAGSPNYTLNWSPPPSSITAVNSGTAAGLVPGINNVTITTANGCTNTASFTVAPILVQASFVIVNPGGSYTVTCNNPNVLLTTSVTNAVPLSYVWFTSCTGTVAGASMNFTQSCTGQVVGTSSTGCTHTETFTIYQDFTSPTIAVTPTLMNITCGVSASTFTGTSNMGPNVTTNWFQISGTNTVYVGVAGGTINILQPGQPGVYWFESTNNLTGCKSTKSVQVTASVGVPVFTVTSPSNFTIGCSTTSVTSMQVSSVITSPIPNVAVNYTFVPPAAASATPTTFTINPNQNNVIIPGVWVVYIKDLTNNCVSSMSISIIQNTIAPNIDFVQPLSILSCKDPSMVLNGISSNPNTSISWTVPALPSNSINPTANTTVTINSAITGATNNITSVGIYTVGSVDNNNLCRSTKTVQINQDIRLPKFSISALTNSVINCKNVDVVIVPIITPSLAVALVPTYVWFPPVGAGVPGTQFNSTAAGSHTSISTSVVNGCTYSATYNIATDLTPPAISAANPFTLDCATNPTVALFPTITGVTTGFTYSWTVPAGALTSNLTASLLVTNRDGLYRILVTNNVNGCRSMESYSVVNGALVADFSPSSENGYAPLTVYFTNTSATSTGASSINCLWSYGNGAATASTVLNTIVTSATYTGAGTYSVVLIATKGTCVDSAMKIIRVDIPSKMEVPNIFTPNGDKVNDIFRLIASNLSEINITVFDRWGNKVYELNSDTGNFAWDGKNQFAKECPAGVYYYLIKAKGKDGQEYEQNGNVSLFR